jgi:hypothetical protein
MSSSLLAGIVIGFCFFVFAAVIRFLPLSNKWFFSLFTGQDGIKAKNYVSKWLLLFGTGFCTLAALPLLTDFRGLRAETFVILAVLSISFSWRLSKKYAAKNRSLSRSLSKA